jgi:GT2 family glycosyltransferase
MQLSVIIVSYNVEAFLSQCLVSVERAITHYSDASGKNDVIEVCVVDNISVDGTTEMVRTKFPWVKLVENTENVGFSIANNQAIKTSEAKYVLLLNPDTVVQEDTFTECMAFADATPKLGCLGVPMFDGTGTFLPESKRGIPTPWASFCRISGLFRLAPGSENLNSYYAGHLQADEINKIEILCGAFMWMRRETLLEVGLLDEDFFMYGEDIDLSWRIIKGGWDNYYFSGTRIIHYKGESTKKGSLNYVTIFYNAMLIFAAKHFEGSQARMFNIFIRFAIYARAGVSIIRRILSKISWPLVEGLALHIGLFILLGFYSDYSGIQYDKSLTIKALCIYSVFWVFTLYLFGGYDKPWIPRRVIRGIAVGSLVLIAGYGLLPEALRFSRAILLLGPFWFAAVVISGRMTLGGWRLNAKPTSRLIIASQTESTAISHMLDSVDFRDDISESTIVIAPNEINTVVDVVRVKSIGEVVFSGRDLSATDIITALSSLVNKTVVSRIAWTDDGSVMGSGGPGPDPVTELDRAIYGPSARRSKRILDLLSSLTLLLFSPLLILSGRPHWISRSFYVLIGKATWVGIDAPGEKSRPSVFNAVESNDDRIKERMNFAYARKYNWFEDLKLVLRALFIRS